MLIEQVIYDAAHRRFIGQVHLSASNSETLQIATAGDPGWSHARIADALLRKARYIHAGGMIHAGA